MSKKSNSGQMLIEIVVAIGVIALVLIGVSDLMVRSAKVVTFQKQKDVAVALIGGLLNDYRMQRDSNPELFYTTVTSTVLDPCKADTAYVCTVIIDRSPDAIILTITADWSDGGETYSTSLSQSLTRTVK